MNVLISTASSLKLTFLPREGSIDRTSASFLQRKGSTAQSTLLAALHEGGFILEDRERLLETVDLRFAPSLAGLIRLRLRDAPVLHFAIVVHDSAQLRVGSLAVCRHVRDIFVQTSILLSLVFLVLILHGLRHGVLLCDLLILRLCVVFLCCLFRQILREIGLYNLKDANNAV